MISKLRGTVVDRAGRVVTLDVNGVGYEVVCSRKANDELGLNAEATLVIYTNVKEDSITLYGFLDQMEKQVFLLLKKVKGVGSRIASEIVSQIDKLELLRAIGAGDVTRLQSVRGIGKKLSERLVVELRERVAEFVVESKESRLHVEISKDEPLRDALEALMALGFSESDANRALKEVRSKGILETTKDSGEIIKEALKYV